MRIAIMTVVIFTTISLSAIASIRENTSAICSLRTISGACEVYRAERTPVTYPPNLKALSETNPPHIDLDLGRGEKEGYKYIYTFISAEKYTCIASPKNSRGGENKTYFVDETGIIRINNANGAPVE